MIIFAIEQINCVQIMEELGHFTEHLKHGFQRSKFTGADPAQENGEVLSWRLSQDDFSFCLMSLYWVNSLWTGFIEHFAYSEFIFHINLVCFHADT